jgi:hypothetical protein
METEVVPSGELEERTEAALDAQEMQAAFDAEVKPDADSGITVEAEQKPAKPAPAKPESKPAPKPAPAPAAADPWEGVNPALRQAFDSQAGTIKQLSDSLRMTQGRVGALQSALDTAKTVSRSAGGGFAIDPAAMAAFRTEFGDDLADHMSKIFVATAEAKQAATEQGRAFDADAFFRERVQPSFATALSDAKAEARELAKLDARHEAWEDTIRTPEFTAWAFDGGPTQAEREAQAQLTDPVQAEAAQNALIRKYPQWWADKGALMDSPKSSDASKLLDAYSSAAQGRATTQQKRNRLAAAVTPRGTQQPAHDAVSDNEAAQAAFEAQFDT